MVRQHSVAGTECSLSDKMVKVRFHIQHKLRYMSGQPVKECSAHFVCMFGSVLWMNVLSIDDGRRLTAFGCQNGCVGLALVNQRGPGN